MIHEVQSTPPFPGFPDLRANVTFVPLQFFTIVVPNSSRGTVRIVGYALRKILGWVDEHGNPTQEQLRFTYRELMEKAGVSRDSIADALHEAVSRCFLRCVRTPQPDRNGQSAQSGIYELCWDHAGRYTDRLDDFRGFYYPEAVVMEEHDGARLVARPKAARKNISNVFCYGASTFTKKRCHLVLCKPNSFLFQTHIYFDFTVRILVDDDFTIVHRF